MGREVRRVPVDWKHPKDAQGRHEPLFDGYRGALAEFTEMVQDKGSQEAFDYFGTEPVRADYLPDWPEAERTHYQMYETTSEGTPISPPFARPEELASWLTVTGASAFGGMTCDFDTWLAMIKGTGSSISAIIQDGKMVSGVEGLSE